jgi:Zn-dependent peptidase ImmA (M78 family)
MLLTKAEATAKKILLDFGIDNVQSLTTIDLKDLIQARGAFYEEILLDGKDGRIVTHNDKSVISINRSISDVGKKRFTAAHELGHYELHKNLTVTADTPYELSNWYQSGSHEKEANDFASELVMPSKLYKAACVGKKFGPKLIEELSKTFLVSRTAAILKFIKSGNHPVCVFCSQNNKVRWWKMSEEMETMEHTFRRGWRRYLVRMSTKLPPPPDSVAGQFMRDKESRSGFEKFQQIEKSTWFATIPEDNPPMFEYCNYVPTYDFALSVVWED